jgi:hydrogenase nickel incorporation protein HypA/HybF
MHELSIAYSLVEVAADAARAAGVTRVAALHLRLGALAGVVSEALQFGYEIATAGTPLEGSRLVITDVPVTVYCPTCDAVVALPNVQLFRCPHCDTPTGDVRGGRELQLEWLEIDDEQPAYS